MAKKLTSAILCMALLFAVNIPAFAAADFRGSVMQPQYTYVNDISSTIGAGSGQAKVYVRLTGTFSVSKIVTVTELQQYRNGSWSPIEIWVKTTYGNSATLFESGSISSGYYYRAVSTFDVYAGSGYETVTKTSNVVWY